MCSVFYLATNTNGTLGGFFYHLFSVVYTSLFLLNVLWQLLKGSQKHSSFGKWFTAATQDHISNSFRLFLLHTFAVRANGYSYIFRQVNHFSKFFWVVNIKSAGFSKLETRFSHFETRFVRVSSILPVLSRRAIVCSQTLYFLFKVRRARVIKKRKEKTAGDLLTANATG